MTQHHSLSPSTKTPHSCWRIRFKQSSDPCVIRDMWVQNNLSFDVHHRHWHSTDSLLYSTTSEAMKHHVGSHHVNKEKGDISAASRALKARSHYVVSARKLLLFVYIISPRSKSLYSGFYAEDAILSHRDGGARSRSCDQTSDGVSHFKVRNNIKYQTCVPVTDTQNDPKWPHHHPRHHQSSRSCAHVASLLTITSLYRVQGYRYVLTLT